jgi:hypothetical protein
MDSPSKLFVSIVFIDIYCYDDLAYRMSHRLMELTSRLTLVVNQHQEQDHVDSSSITENDAGVLGSLFLLP